MRSNRDIILSAVQDGTLRALYDYHRARLWFSDRSGLFTLLEYIESRHKAGETSLQDKGNRSRAMRAARKALTGSPYIDTLGGDLFRARSLRKIMKEITGFSRGPAYELPPAVLSTWAAFLDYCISVVASGTFWKIDTLGKTFQLSRRRIISALGRESDKGRLHREKRFVFSYHTTKQAAQAARESLQGLHAVFVSGPVYINASHGWGLIARTSNKYSFQPSRIFKGIKKQRFAIVAKGAGGKQYFKGAAHVKKPRIRKKAGESEGAYIARKVQARKETEGRRKRWERVFPGELLTFGKDYNLTAWAFENSRIMRDCYA